MLSCTEKETAQAARSPAAVSRLKGAFCCGAQVSSFLVLDMMIHIWHQLPWLGRLAGPVTQFLNMLECMSMPQAVILAALGFVGPLQWWTFQFVRLWRTSRVSGLLFCAKSSLSARHGQDSSLRVQHAARC